MRLLLQISTDLLQLLLMILNTLQPSLLVCLVAVALMDTRLLSIAIPPAAAAHACVHICIDAIHVLQPIAMQPCRRACGAIAAEEHRQAVHSLATQTSTYMHTVRT